MDSLFNFRYKFLLLLALLFNVSSSLIAKEHEIKSSIKLKDVVIDQQITFQDPIGFEYRTNLQNADWQYFEKQLTDYIQLEFVDSNNVELIPTGTIEVNIQLLRYSDLNNLTNPQQSNVQLLIELNQLENNVQVKSRDNFFFLNEVYFGFKVTSITAPSFTTLPENVYLNYGCKWERDLQLQTSGSNPLVPNLSIQYQSSNNSLEFEIDKYYGEAIELEWTWVSNSNGKMGANEERPEDSLFVNFTNNSSRVRLSPFFDFSNPSTTGSIKYSFPLIYDQGFIIYRVRAVGIDQTTLNEYRSAWSAPASGMVSDYTNKYKVENGFEENINWQHNVTYIEEGKRSDELVFADGTFRVRQNVAFNPADNQTIVSETFYDHQGRAAITALPVPSGSNLLAYYSNFNSANGETDSYNRSNFDLDEVSDPCVSIEKGMSVQSGASKYYSTNNPDKTGINGYIPDANLFPFTRTVYMPDNSNRPKAVSSPGSDFKISSGHETEYFYGTPTSQNELDRYFGSDIGYLARYKKNMVEDANGQISISYLSASGKTIATCLAGNDPQNLLTLSSNTGATEYTSDLLNSDNDVTNNVVNEQEGTITLGKTLVVDTETDYDFSYNILGEVYQDNFCEEDVMCFECIYNLTLSVKDVCGQELIPGGPITDQVGSLAYACSTETSVNQNFTVHLTPGTYNVSRVLRVDEESLNTYLNYYLENNDCIKPLSYFVDSAIVATDFSSCFEGAEDCFTSCEEEIGTYQSYLQVNPNAPESEWQALINECVSNCNYDETSDMDGGSYCAMFKDRMLQDVSPGGQYASLTTNDSLSVFATVSRLPANYLNSSAVAGYQLSTTPDYLNADGTMAYIYLKRELNDDGNYDYEAFKATDGTIATEVPLGSIQLSLAELSGIEVLTNDPTFYGRLTIKELNKDHFASYFEEQWAEQLLYLHPEYCQLDFCLTNEDAFSFSDKLQNIDTYAGAVAAGYMPATVTNISNTGVLNNFAGNLFTNDPIKTYTNNFIASNQHLDVAFIEFNKYGLGNNLNPVTSNYNVLQLAYYQTFYQGAITNPGINEETATFDGEDECKADEFWQNFRDLYVLARKKELDVLSLKYSVENGCYNGGMGIFYTDNNSMKNFFNKMNNAYVNYVGSAEFNCRVGLFASTNFLLSTNDCDNQINNSDNFHNINNATFYKAPSYINNFAYYKNKIRVFPTVLDYIYLPPFNPSYFDASISGIAASQTQVLNNMAASCTESCEGYADKWIADLENCSNIDQNWTSNKATLRSVLINICENGCDGTNPFGAISTAPGNPVIYTAGENTYNFTTFEDAIKVIVYGNANATVTTDCTQDLISFPGLYVTNDNTQTSGYSSLDKCACNTLYELKTDYLKAIERGDITAAEVSFNTFVSDVLAISVKNASQLLCSCSDVYTSITNQAWNGTQEWPNTAIEALTALNLNAPIAVSCNNSCTNCNQILNLVDQFETKYNVTNVLDSIDLHQPLANFLNQQLNYTQHELTYFDFINNCKKLSTQNGTVCQTNDYAAELSQLINAIIRESSSGNCLCESPFNQFYPTSSIAQAIEPNFTPTPTLTCDHTYQVTPYGRDSLMIVLNNPGGNSCTLKLIVPEPRPANFANASIINISDIQPDANYPSSDNGQHFTALIAYMPKGIKELSYLTIKGYSSCFGVGTCINNYVENDTLQLCNQSIEAIILDDLDTNTCYTQLLNTAINNAKIAYEQYVNQFKDDFKNNYLKHCVTFGGSINETFTVTYNSNTFHYTLYYYDRANNLIKTVPPQGVNTVNNFTQTTAARNTNNSNVIAPAHDLQTRYYYNSLNQLVKQTTPDGGETKFYYDELGRLILSQNEKQKYQFANQRFSYTVYDALGRIVEAGELESANPQLLIASTNNNYMFNQLVNYTIAGNSVSNKKEFTNTYYDRKIAMFDNYFPNNNSNNAGQKNLRGRVSAAAHFNEEDNSTPNEITVYSYDIHGNVKTLLHHHKNSELEINDFKKIDYFYDLISGKVNKVFFEKGNKDQFIHSYTYDKNNRIEAVYTSRNGVVWDKDAAYSYYKHGPLSRLTIGNNRVQAMDYYYTLQGWIKGVNSELINNTADPGVAYNNKFMPQDAFGYSLRYYGGDYTSIGNQQGLSYALANNSAIQGAYNTHAPNLYNGNISAMHSSGMFGNTPSDVKSSVNFYKYDLLNRIRTSVTYTEANYSGNSWLMPSTNLTDYATSYTYDGNGNIKTLNRNASTLNSNPLEMDDLTYHYYPHTNKLEYVSDNNNYTNNYQVDIDNQNELNFTYDSIGNLVSDASEEIETIKWTVFGKIKEIIRTSNSTKPNLVFEYDATGNRISKLVIPKLSSGAIGPLNRWIYTVYYRDAQGNILATYIRKPNMLDIAEYKVEEFSIYGSSRIGVKNADDLDASLFNDVYYAEALGLKTFELSDHLGNVREVISDRKIPGEFIKTYSTQNFESCQTPGDCGIYAEIPSPPGEYPYSGTTLQIVNNQGSKHLRIATDYQWDGAHIAMATEAGQRYLLELDASFNTSNIGVRLSVYPKNPGGSEYLDIAIAPGHNSVEFTANTALTDIKPYRAYNFGTPGVQDEFFIDNIMLKAIYTTSPPSDAQVLNYKPDVAAANEYYPFGMLIESRKHLAFGGDYAYGFNGKMVDKEVKSEGNQQDYGLRIYDTRLGKFLSVDPLSREYPWNSTYAFAENDPINFIDLDGAEKAKTKQSTTTLIVVIQGWAGGTDQENNPLDGATQSKNAAKTNSKAGPDLGLGKIGAGRKNVEVVTFASSMSGNTTSDVEATILDFQKQKPKGKVIIVGHSLGASNAVDVLQRAKVKNITALITIDPSSGDGKFFYGPNYASKEIPSGMVENVINYYLNPEAKLEFDNETNGVNIQLISKGSLNHTNIDNTMVPFVIEDINNADKGVNAVQKAKGRDYNNVKTIQNDNQGGSSQ